MDLASILGMLLCFGMFAYGVIDNAGLANMNRYLDFPSAIITFGGSFFAVMASKSMSEYIAFTLFYVNPQKISFL